MNQTCWKEAVVYQIYPRSFKDSNADGVGDLRGVIQKLDYLQTLGVTLVWLCPVYRSPNDDNGYDISDYHAIMDEFGTFADWEELLAGLHARGIRLVMDLVVNHTSEEHPWFLELKQVMTRWQKELEGKGWNSQYLTNHDLPRAVSRFGDDGRYRVESAKLLAIFLHLLHGTPYVYPGEEIGMTNVAFAFISDYRDIETLNMYREFVEEGWTRRS